MLKRIIRQVGDYYGCYEFNAAPIVGGNYSRIKLGFS